MEQGIEYQVDKCKISNIQAENEEMAKYAKELRKTIDLLETQYKTNTDKPTIERNKMLIESLRSVIGSIGRKCPLEKMYIRLLTKYEKD